MNFIEFIRNERENVQIEEHGRLRTEPFQDASLVENCLLENNVLFYLSPAPIPPLIHLSLSPKARYMRMRAVCARDSKKGSRGVRWQLFHIWRMDILQALSQRQKASSHKRTTWSEFCALGLSYSFTVPSPLHLREEERERKKRINIPRPKSHMRRRSTILILCFFRCFELFFSFSSIFM